MKNKFKFTKCAYHYSNGCNDAPELKFENKEMCMKCYAKEIWEDLAYGIKYGRLKNIYKNDAKNLSAFKKR